MLIQELCTLYEKDIERVALHSNWIKELIFDLLYYIDGFSPKLLMLTVAAILLKKRDRAAFLLYKYYEHELSEVEKQRCRDMILKVGLSTFGHPLAIATHSIVKPIRAWPQNVLLNTLDEIQKVCESEESITSFIGYGTLLGWYRENDFIEHDDDMDVLVILRDTKISVLDIIDRLVIKLEAIGFRVSLSRTDPNKKIPFIHVFDANHSVCTDIFMGFVENDKISLPLQKMCYKHIPKEVFCPPQKFKFGDKFFNIPNETSSFLQYRYGENWQIPDVDFRHKE